MAEHRISFTPIEMELMRTVLDHMVNSPDVRLDTVQTYAIDTTALRIAKQNIARLRSKLFPSMLLSVSQPKKVSA